MGKILAVDKNANEEEIKKAYRKRAMVHHPDRHAGATEVEKKDHEQKFKEVGEAYAILSDEKKRRMYDSGQDIEDGGGGGFHDVDPKQHFPGLLWRRWRRHGWHGWTPRDGRASLPHGWWAWWQPELLIPVWIESLNSTRGFSMYLGPCKSYVSKLRRLPFAQFYHFLSAPRSPPIVLF